MSENWDRQYRCTIGQPGGTGVVLGGTVGESGMPLHIAFTIEKGDKEASNTATVKFWNLSPATITEIKNKNAVLELKAGYGANMPSILLGNITTSETVQENADTITTIEVSDGLVAIRDTYISLSFAKGINGLSIIQAIGTAMGISTLIADDAQPVLSQKIFTNGYSAVGKGKTVLKKICETCGLKWSIQNGVLQVVIANSTITQQAYVLNSSTGLLDKPKKITESGSDTEENTQTGYEVRCFLNGAIGVNDLVSLDSKTIKGFYRVASISINGDNFDGEWTSTMKLMEVAG